MSEGARESRKFMKTETKISYKIVEKSNPLAVHSIGYWGEDGKKRAQARIDSKDCNRHGWLQPDGSYAYDTIFIVIPE